MAKKEYFDGKFAWFFKFAGCIPVNRQIKDEAAKGAALEVLKQDQSDWNAYVELGKVCMALNDNAAAEKYFVYVQEKNPTFRKAEIESLLASISAANITSLNH
mgnify:CR=1 FL=1